MFLIAWMVWDSMLPGTIVPSVGGSPILEGFEVSFALTQGSQSGLKREGVHTSRLRKGGPSSGSRGCSCRLGWVRRERGLRFFGKAFSV